jgi:Icc protein
LFLDYLTVTRELPVRASWITDIHLNFLEEDTIVRFESDVLRDEPDVVLLTGDIGESDSVAGYLVHLEAAFDRPIYFVLGNHDFYRSSVRSVRSDVTRLANQSTHLTYLNDETVIELTKATALIGHDTWPDGRFGNYDDSRVVLNDAFLIKELISDDKTERLARMQELADAGEQHLRRALLEAVDRFTEIVLLAHVPPFKESSLYEGRISGDDWLPHFSCKAVGDLLLEVLGDHPSVNLTVLCGHTHGEGSYRPLANLTVHAGGAIYGNPTVQSVIDLQ